MADVTPTIDLEAGAASRAQWFAEMRDHRAVLWILARKDFQVRYKRATLGILWAVAVPIVQAAVLTFVFSRFVPVQGGVPYGVYVLSGILPWGFFSGATSVAVTSIVDGAGLTDKIWFPRAVLPLVSCVSSLVGLGISMVVLLVATPVIGGSIGFRILLLVPACALLFAFTAALALVLSALNVYFRDVRFLVSAGLVVWLYCTPILYQKSAVKGIGPWLDLNPLTGIVALFRVAALGVQEPWARAVSVTIAMTVVLLVAAVEAHRRHDRLFVDLL